MRQNINCAKEPLYRFWVLDEDFCASHLILVSVHVDRPEEVKDPLLLRSPPTRPRFSRENGIPDVDPNTEKHNQSGCSVDVTEQTHT